MNSGDFALLEDYGIIGNLETCALVCRTGSIDWYCLPHLDSPSVFGALLDTGKGGHFRIRPTSVTAGSQSYRGNTNVLETTFETPEGRARVTDFMPMLSDDPEAPFAEPWLYRKAECLEGDVDMAVDFQPRFDYARARTTVEPTQEGVLARGDGTHLSLSTPKPLDTSGDGASAVHTMTAGDEGWYTLQYSMRKRPDSVDPQELLELTETYWHNWVHECSHPTRCLFRGPWHDEIVRSELTLKLLMQRETGAIAAAPTTSLPERIGASRNWDYRFNWIRDAALAVNAFYRLGHVQETWDFFDWCLNLAHGDSGSMMPFQPLYGLHGETELHEEILDHLSGYRDSSPVRIGNAARHQLQLDIFGELVNVLSKTARFGAPMTEESWTTVRNIVDFVCVHWDHKDMGIWEVRSDPQHFVHSKVMCWVALDRGLKMAQRGDWSAPHDRWSEVRAEIRADILDNGFDEEQNTFLRSYEADEALDAATLRIPLVGFLPFDDERVQGTIDAVMDRLGTADNLVYRYKGEDGIPSEEGIFILCTCWLVDCLAFSGRIEEAETLFETLLDHASPLGLFAEEIDPMTGELRGNFPQAFSHLGVVNSALHLRAAKGEEELLEPHLVGFTAGDTVTAFNEAPEDVSQGVAGSHRPHRQDTLAEDGGDGGRSER